MAETTANAIADYIIQFCRDRGELITNLHLQKLVYYAQAWYLALHDKPLFDEDFQAWARGPVQPELHDRFKKFKWNPISEYPEKVELPKHVEEHMLEVMDVYGRNTSYYLERMTQDEEPWRKARGGMPIDEHSEAVISQKFMQKYYKTLLEDDDEEETQASEPYKAAS